MQAASPAGGLILVIDDDPDLRESVADLLQIHGYLVAQAENGQTAIDMMKQLKTPPALILLDLSMPVLDGWRFLRRMRRRKRLNRVPIVVMTGEEVSAIAGAAMILRKPVGAEQLLAAVAQFVT
jgi:CheY-like chemotaxis protein